MKILHLAAAVAAISTLLCGCEARKTPEPEAAPEQPRAVGFPAAKNRAVAAPAKTYVCTTQIAAYDPARPDKRIGFFKSGSELRLSETPTAPGMVMVTYQDPAGPTLITALCSAEDLGLTGPPAPAGSTPAPQALPSQQPQQQQIEKPKGLGGSQQQHNNPKFKPIGGSGNGL